MHTIDREEGRASAQRDFTRSGGLGQQQYCEIQQGQVHNPIPRTGQAHAPPQPGVQLALDVVENMLTTSQ